MGEFRAAKNNRVLHLHIIDQTPDKNSLGDDGLILARGLGKFQSIIIRKAFIPDSRSRRWALFSSCQSKNGHTQRSSYDLQRPTSCTLLLPARPDLPKVPQPAMTVLLACMHVLKNIRLGRTFHLQTLTMNSKTKRHEAVCV